MAAFSGFYESHNPPPLGDARGIVPPHCDGHLNGSKVGTCCIIFVLIDALAAARAIQSK
jgi:hypothetical protein